MNRDVIRRNETKLMLVVAFMFLNQIFTNIASTMNMFGAGWFPYFSGALTFLWGFIPIIIASTLTEKSMRTGAFIMGGIFLVNSAYYSYLSFSNAL